MIILFEDRKERKEQFISNNEQFPLISESSMDCSNLLELNDYLKNNFKDAKVILLHKSYEFKDKTITPENFKTASQTALNVPVVMFSGGSNSNLIHERVFITAEVNSGVMYKNLRLFHDEYQRTGTPNIPLLVYGANYRVNQLMEIQAKINLYFFNRRSTEMLNENDVEEIMDITDAITSENEKNKLDKMWNWIEGKGVENVTIGAVLSLVQRMINQL